MRNMGGLRAKMPMTFWTFMIATVALAGLPFTSGFLSKDAILAGALGYGFLANPTHVLLPILAFLGAALTDYYMFRLIFLTFMGDPKDKRVTELAHESPKVMTIPLVVLSALSLWFWYSPNPVGEGWFHQLVQEPERVALHGDAHASGVIGAGEVVAAAGHDAAHAAHYPAMALSILIAVAAIGLAYRHYYNRRQEALASEAKSLESSWLFQRLHHKWHFDEFYEATFIRLILVGRMALNWFDAKVIDGLVNLSSRVTVAFSSFDGLFDNLVVDGAVNGVASVITRAGAALRRVQTGRLQAYIVMVLAGILVLMLIRMI
jgi:NADH-quinone oxidoreductase subunit L